MNYLKFAFLGLLVSFLSACGGGGGNPGNSGGSGANSTVGGTATSLSLLLLDSKGTSVRSVPANGDGVLAATLVSENGLAVANQVVKVVSVASKGLLFFPNGQTAITDANGVAKIAVRRTSLATFGSDSIAVGYEGCVSSCNGKYLSSTSPAFEFSASAPTFSLEFLDSSNSLTKVISSSGLTTLKATLKYEDGTPVVQKMVEITGDLTQISFPEGSSQLTDSDGIAVVKIARSAGSVVGAGVLKAAATISTTDVSGSAINSVVTGTVNFSLGVAVGAQKLSLANFDVGTAALAAYGTRQIVVQVNLGAVAATSPVQVNFSSNCGQISPATATSNAAGIATTSFTATDAVGATISSLGCGGKSVEISASAVGADSVRKSLSVSAAPAVNLGFVVPSNPSKSRIYLANSGGATQTSVDFLLTNARGEAIPSQDVLLTLKTVNGGTPKATFSTFGNVNPVTLTTDSFGKVTVPVFSGTVPTNVLVNAALVSNPSIQTDSSTVAIASGRPAQSRVSLVPAKHAIRGFNFDGATTTLTMSLADRQGNPVPDGTAVNFVSEAGVMIPPTCVTGAVPGDSQCTVTIRSQNPRNSSRRGYVSILAYAAGEEDFVDANFSNAYDSGDTFTADLGTAYRDDFATKNIAPGTTKLNLDGTTSSIRSWDGTMYVHQSGEFAVPRTADAGGTTPVPNQGDGVWGAVDVRGQVVIVFSTDDFDITSPLWTSASDAQWNNSIVATALNVSIQDLNGRSVPTGSTIAATVTDNSPKAPSDGAATSPTYGTCALVSQSHGAVPDSLEPLAFSVALKQCISGDQVSITVTTPAVSKTVTFSVP